MIAGDSIGTVTVGAMATLLPFGRHTPLPDDYSKDVIAAIAQQIVVPNPLAFSVYGTRFPVNPPNSTGPQALYPTFSAEFLVTFRKNGSVKELSITQKSLTPAIDNAIAAAIRAADAAGAFPPVARASEENELRVFVDVDFSGCPGCRHSWPIFSATVPLYSAARNVSQTARVAPKYPEDLRRRGREGNVSLKFVVDESGRIADGAYRFMDISEVAFGEEVLRILPRLRYEPARIGSCNVKQLVQQAFNFRIF